MRRIASFGPAVLVADALILLGLVGIIAYSVHVSHRCGCYELSTLTRVISTVQGLADYASSSSSHPLVLEAFNKKDFALFLGTAIYAFEGIGWCRLECTLLL